MICAEHGSVSVAKLLIAAKCDVNLQESELGNTALHIAATKYAEDTVGEAKWEDMIGVLCDEGKAPALFNDKGKCPDAGGDEADFCVQQWMADAEKLGKVARKDQQKQRQEAQRQAFNKAQEEYQNSCSDAMVTVMDSGSHEGYKGAMHL